MIRCANSAQTASMGQRVNCHVSPLLALVFLAAGSVLGGPAEAVSAAVADVRRMPPELQHSIRYLSLHAIPKEARADFLKVLSFHCNSLSREADIIQPRMIGDIAAVNLLDYAWKAEVWERFAAVYPYYHFKVVKVPVVEVPVVPVVPVIPVIPDMAQPISPEKGEGPLGEAFKIYRDGPGNSLVEISHTDLIPGETVWVKDKPGRSIRKVVVPKAKAEVREKTVEKPKEPAPVVPARVKAADAGKDAEEYATLVLLTGSEIPIVRADWFIYQTAIQEGRGTAGYYDFLSLGKKEADFQELIAADVKAAQRVKREMAASVGRSGVTLNNRGIEWFATITGDYYRSQDFKTSTFKQNALRLLDGDTDPPKGDASEQYGSLPNGLFAFWLQNANGERQNAAPDFIAGDTHTISSDKRVHIGKSCISCHQEGIRPIRDWVRNVYSGPVQLASTDYAKLKRLRQLYLSDLEGRVKQSNAVYAGVLKKVNGLTPEANAKAYNRVWDEYFEKDLGPKEAAFELGVSVETLTKALKAYGTKKLADPVLLGLLADQPAAIRREHWEESIQLAQEIVKGVKP